MGFGVFVLLLSLVIAPLPGLLLDRSMPGIPMRFIGRAFDRPPQVAGVTLCSFVLLIVWYILSQKIRHTTITDRTMGALLFMLVAMLGTSIVFPALSFLFTWPLLFSLLTLASWFYYPKVMFPVLLLSGIASIVIMVPTLMLGLFDQMVLTLPLLGILCGFMIPQIFWFSDEFTQ
jgi:hypothetical protein